MSKQFSKVNTKVLSNTMKRMSEQDILDIIVSGYPWTKSLKDSCQTLLTKRFYNCLYSGKKEKELLTVEEVKYMLELNPNTIWVVHTRNFTLIQNDGTPNSNYDWTDFISYVIKQGFEYLDKVCLLLSGKYTKLSSPEIVTLITTNYRFNQILNHKHLKFSADEWEDMLDLKKKKVIVPVYEIGCDVDETVQKEYFIRICKDYWKTHEESDSNFYYLSRELYEVFKGITNRIKFIQNFKEWHAYCDHSYQSWKEFLRNQVIDPSIDLTVEEANACGARLEGSDKILLSL